MKVELFQYQLGKGWSIPTFPTLDSANTLILIFAAPQFIQFPDPILELLKHYPLANMIGCSSAGEIYGPRVWDYTMSVAVIKFEKTKIKVFKADMTDNIEQAGYDLMRQLNQTDLRAMFVLAEGLQLQGSKLLEGLNLIKDNSILMTGALAGDGQTFKHTWEIFNGEISTHAAIAVGFYGEHIQVGHSIQHGWQKMLRDDVIAHLLQGQVQADFIQETQHLGERAINSMMDIATHKPTPILSIAISNVARRLVLGNQSETEPASLLQSLPFGTKQIGFYSYGEFAPLASGKCALHHQAMSLTTFCED